MHTISVTMLPIEMLNAGGKLTAYSCRIIVADRTEDNPITNPTDRSMPPVIITNVSDADRSR
jgi:hypothetical protein